MKAALCGFLFSAMASAMAEEAPASWQVRADFQIVQIPQARALALVPRLLDEASAKEAYAEVQAGIASGEVTLAADLSGHAPDGAQSGPIGELVDLRYPIEFEQEDPRMTPAPDQIARATKPVYLGYPSTTFETKSIGPMLDFGATVTAGGKLVEITFTAQTAAFEEWTRYETAVRADGLTLFVDQPVFSMRRTNTSTVLRPGIPQLVGSFQLPGAAPVMELHLLNIKLRNLTARPGAAVPETVAAEPREPASGEKPVTGPWHMQAELHKFHVTPKEALLLRPQLLDPARVDAAFQRLLELTVAWQARLVEWQNLPLRSGSRSVCENIREQRYAIEFEMGPGPMNFSEENPPVPMLLPPPAFKYNGHYDPPTTFETKYLGTTMEMETLLEGGGFISLNLNVASVECPAFMRWNDVVTRLGKRTFAYQPQFEVRKTATNLNLKNGARTLLSFHRLLDRAGESARYEIVLLRVSARDLDSK